jgi:phosphate-selective porin OprO/OprP
VKGYGLLTVIVLTGLHSLDSNAVGAGANDPNTTATKTVEDRLAELEQNQKVIERQLEIEREQAAEKAKTTPLVTANPKDGFSIKSSDGDFLLRLRGLLQADSRFVSGKEDPKASDDTFLLRRVRPIFEGTVFGDVDFRLVPDFGEGKAAVQDAYLDFKYLPQAKLQVGRYKVPFGIERLQSNADTLFTELALSGNLTPNYDIGATLHSESLWGGTLSYAAGVFNGAADNASTDADIDGNKEFVARVFATPWKGWDIAWLDGFGIGFAVTAGNKEGNAARGQYLPSYKTPGQQTFFKYRDDTFAEGEALRYSPQVYYSYGSFGLLAEYIVSSQKVTRGANSDTLQSKGWQAAGSYVLTGEAASYKSVVPRQVFDPVAGTWGAFEVVGRISQLNVDEKAFSTYADPAKYAQAARAWGLGLNWYWNKNVKWMLDYEHTAFRGGETGGRDREAEEAILARAQLAF